MTTTHAGSEVNLPALRQQITGLVARNAVAMVQAAIDGALEQGQYQAIKYLFEMIGIYPGSTAGEGEPDDSLSRLLLKEIGVPVPDKE